MDDIDGILSRAFWSSTHEERIAYLRAIIQDHGERMTRYRAYKDYGEQFFAVEMRIVREWRDLLSRIEADETWRPPGVKSHAPPPPSPTHG